MSRSQWLGVTGQEPVTSSTDFRVNAITGSSAATNRLLIVAADALAPDLSSSSTGDLVGATRDLPDGCLATGEVFTVELAVWVTTNPVPDALIVTEKLPKGWTVTGARWNGNLMPYDLVKEEYKWMFGVGTSVGSGTLTYQTQASGQTGDVFTITGTLLVYGTPTVATLGDQEVRMCDFLDADGDGMPDDWELLYFNGPTNAAAGVDYDGDGMTTYQEYLADTNPTNDASILRINGICVGNDGVEVIWQGGEASVQFLETTADLTVDDGWTVRRTVVPPTPRTNLWVDQTNPAPTNAFYRIRAVR